MQSNKAQTWIFLLNKPSQSKVCFACKIGIYSLRRRLSKQATEDTDSHELENCFPADESLSNQQNLGV